MWAPLPWHRCRSCRRCSRAGWSFSRCSRSATSAFGWDAGNGRRDNHRCRARGDRDHGGSHTSALRHYSLAALIAVECGVFALGAALIRISMRGSLGPAARGLLLGVAAGVLFGVSDIALKYLTEALHGGVQGIVSKWTLAALAASVLAFYASARGLQLAPRVAVI